MNIKAAVILILLMICAQSVRSDVTDGLVGWWKLDETSGNALDSSGSGNTGTPTGTTILTTGCKIRNCRSFNGSSDEVTMGNVLDFSTGDFSLSVWINPPNSNQAGYIIGKREAGSPYHQYSMFAGYINGAGGLVSSKKIGLFFYAGDGAANAQSMYTTNDVFDGQWHHVSATRSGLTIHIYVDGVDQPLTVVSNTMIVNVTNTGNLTMGRNNDIVYYNGKLDDVRVYNRALSSNEVMAIYQAGTPHVSVKGGGKISGMKVK